MKFSLAQPILNPIGILLSTLNSVSAWNLASGTQLHFHTGVTLNGPRSHRELKKKKPNCQLDTSNIFTQTLTEAEPHTGRSLAKLSLPPEDVVSENPLSPAIMVVAVAEELADLAAGPGESLINSCGYRSLEFFLEPERVLPL